MLQRIRIRTVILLWILLSGVSVIYAQSSAWTEISDNVPSFLPDGDFLDVQFIGNEGWIVFSELYDNGGIILHTENGGLSFNMQQVPQLPNVIDMVTAEIGFVGCLSGNVYYTTNGGGQWNFVSGISGSEIYGIDAINDPLIGYVCGQDGWIAKFDTNQFLSLQKPFGSWIENFDLYDLAFPLDTNEGWVCGEKIIGHFSNGTWDSLTAPYCDPYYALSFIDEQTGWCAGGQGTLMTPIIANTTDGINWQQQQQPLIDQWLYDIYFLDQEYGWSVGMYILATTNGGNTWVKEADSFMNIWNAVDAVDESAVYVVGNNKRILKKDLHSSINEIHSAIYITSYPNPFTTATTLEFTLKGNSKIQLSIYNAMGEEVYQIEETYDQGTHKVTWSPAYLSPGLYYAVLRSEDGVSVVKMVKK